MESDVITRFKDRPLGATQPSVSTGDHTLCRSLLVSVDNLLDGYAVRYGADHESQLLFRNMITVCRQTVTGVIRQTPRHTWWIADARRYVDNNVPTCWYQQLLAVRRILSMITNEQLSVEDGTCNAFQLDTDAKILDTR